MSHSNSLLPLCYFSVFVGESLQKAHFLGDILPVRVRARDLLGFRLGFEFVLSLDTRETWHQSLVKARG